MSELFQISFRIMGAVFRVLMYAVRTVAGSLSTYAQGRGARRGLLAPGDPAPPATKGGAYYDYRGVLGLRDAPMALRAAPFGIGRYIDPRSGARQHIGLPPAVVDRHVALIGPSGSGKTTGLIVPWIIGGLRAGYSVVTIDVKGDLLDRVLAEVRAQGRPVGARAQAFDYTRPATSVAWNWIGELDSDRAIDNAVQSILGMKAPTGTDPYFFNLDSQILRGLLELASLSPRRDSLTAGRLLALLKDQNKLTKSIARYPTSPAAVRLRDLETLDPIDYAKRVTGVAVRLDALARPTVEAVTGRVDLRVADVLRERRLISVVGPKQDGQMAHMLSSLFVNQLLFRAYDRFTNPGGVPLLLVLDEAAQLGDRVDFENVLSVARAAQVAVVLAVQDAAQFKDENQRSIVFANCGTLICLSGVSSESAKVMSDRVGQHPVQTSSVSKSGWGSPSNNSTGIQMVPVLGAREIMLPPFGGRSAVVHARDIADRPFIVDLSR